MGRLSFFYYRERIRQFSVINTLAFLLLHITSLGNLARDYLASLNHSDIKSGGWACYLIINSVPRINRNLPLNILCGKKFECKEKLRKSVVFLFTRYNEAMLGAISVELLNACGVVYGSEAFSIHYTIYTILYNIDVYICIHPIYLRCERLH